MTSTKTQLPYDYYDIGVHCKPSNGTKYKSENLGKIEKNDENSIDLIFLQEKFFEVIELLIQNFK